MPKCWRSHRHDFNPGNFRPATVVVSRSVSYWLALAVPSTFRPAGRDYRLTDVHGHVVREIVA